MPVELKVPEVGESITEVHIGKWHKSPGDRVEKDEPVVELESDKATVDLPGNVHAEMIGSALARHHRPAVGDEVPAIRPLV